MPVSCQFSRRRLKFWLQSTGYSEDQCAAYLTLHGHTMSRANFSHYVAGRQALPWEVVLVLRSMGRPDIWDAAQHEYAALLGDEDTPTEDHLGLERRGYRGMGSAGDLVRALAGALENGEIDGEERAHLLPIVRDHVDDATRLLDLLAQPAVRRVG